MTKSKSDLLRTSENKRVSPYGEYYISVKKIEVSINEREDRGASPPYIYTRYHPPRYPMLMIRAVFESDKGYFGKTSKGRWVHNIPLSAHAYTTERDTYNFDVSIYSPGLTTLNIIKGKCFIRLLLEDKEVTGILAHSLDCFDMPVLPGTPPISLFESFLKRQIVDIETKLKLQIGYPIAFEDIEGAQNMEVREEALRKFGYEDYVRVGFERGKIDKVTVDRDEVVLANNSYYYIGTQDKVPPLSKKFDPRYNQDEKLIFMENDIAFLQVKDTSTGKAYFLKVPPNMDSVKEAKAWTFGLNPGEYNPVVET